MGKAIRGLPETPALSDGAETSEAIGAYISRQRRLRGISLEELEQLTRIPRRSLERLESGAFDAEPDGFVRGFVRTVAVAIGLDPDDTLARMLAEPDLRGKRRGIPNLSNSAATLLLVGLFVLGAGVLWSLVENRPVQVAEAAAVPETRHFRRDAVRELAISRGIIPESEVPSAQPLKPVQAPPPE